MHLARWTLIALVPLLGCEGEFRWPWQSGDGVSEDTGEQLVFDTAEITPEELTCRDLPITPPPGSGSGACITADLACGDTVVHTNFGGGTQLDDEYSTSAWGCVGSDPLVSDYSGPERRYWLSAPEDRLSTIALESDCDLTMKIVRLASPCPVDGQSVDCSDAVGAFDESRQSWELFPGFDYEIIVESVNGSIGGYSLSYTCED